MFGEEDVVVGSGGGDLLIHSAGADLAVAKLSARVCWGFSRVESSAGINADPITPQAAIIELLGVVCGSMPRTKNPSGGAEHAESGNLDVPTDQRCSGCDNHQVQPALISISIYLGLETR